MNKFQSIELFSGAGGLALGLEMAGWRHIALIERNEPACETIRLNKSRGHSFAEHWWLLQDDVRNIEYSDFEPIIDMIAGGPPCQPFSLGGKHRAFNDERDMFPEAVRAVRELKPKCFVFENVRGLLRDTFAPYFNYIILQLSLPNIRRSENEDWAQHYNRLKRYQGSGGEEGLTYNVSYRLLDAVDYGIPQFRHRVFIVGFRSDLETQWQFPQPTHSVDRLLWDQWITGDYWDYHHIPRKKKPVLNEKLAKRIERLSADFRLFPPPGLRALTIRDAIAGLPDPATAGGSCPNHEYRDGARSYPGHTGSRLDEPSKTIKAGDHGVPGGENMVIADDGSCRYFTVRESARIQTFPDDYLFSGSWTEAMRQIGNAVPVKLARAVGLSVIKQAWRGIIDERNTKDHALQSVR